MPEQYTLEVQARFAQRGDYLGDIRGKVTDVNVKQKYTFISDENHDKPQRFTHSEMIRVRRERLTAEEQAAQDRHDALRKIDWEERYAEQNYRDAASNMRKYLDGDHYGSFGPYDTLMIADARWELWQTVRRNHLGVNQIILRDGEHRIRRFGSEDRVITEYTRFDAITTMARHIWREVTVHTSRLHRSTAIMSNAMSDAQLDARLEFLRDFEEILDASYSSL